MALIEVALNVGRSSFLRGKWKLGCVNDSKEQTQLQEAVSKVRL